MKKGKHPVVHFEIGCEDKQATGEFYKSVFDWEITPREHSLDISTGGTDDLSGHITALGHEPHRYINIYIEVEDIEKCFERVEANGGKRLIGPVPLPDGSSFGWFQDVAGNMVGVLVPANA